MRRKIAVLALALSVTGSALTLAETAYAAEPPPAAAQPGGPAAEPAATVWRLFAEYPTQWGPQYCEQRGKQGVQNGEWDQYYCEVIHGWPPLGAKLWVSP